jgi:LPXTG-site transpeptidase (sortase) family protein
VKPAFLWLVHCLEWTLLGIGIGTLGVYGYETVEARRFKAEQTAAFELAAGTAPAPRRVATLPWEAGNSAIAGHRDGLFRPLKDVKVGDEIRFRTTSDEFVYRVTRTSIVEPDDLSVLERRPETTLTLITCYPFYYVGSAPQRFIVQATRE